MTRNVGCAALLSATLLLAQSREPDHPEFAVTSVKPSEEAGRPAYGTGNGRGYGRNVTLKILIGLAWQVQQFQIVGGPGWAASERFEVEGRAGDATADYATLRRMMQSLLSDRFQLRVHREMREASVYALAIAKGGAKIKSSSDQASPDVVGPQAAEQDGPNRGGILMGPGLLVGNAVRLSQVATLLTTELDRVVVDKTNLAGRFDVRLRWTPDSALSANGGAVPVNPSDAPSIFTAVQEQLGLKLQPARSAVEFLVIDGATRPGAN